MAENRLTEYFECPPGWLEDAEKSDPTSTYCPQADDLMSGYEEPVYAESHKSLWTVVEQLKQSEVDRLERRIEHLEHAAIAFRGVIYPVNSILPGRLFVKKTIHAQVVYEDDSYIACFADANINASGVSEIDAVENLRDSIATAFLAFSENQDRLGREPTRQLSVLREFIRSDSKWQVARSLIKWLKRPLKNLRPKT